MQEALIRFDYLKLRGPPKDLTTKLILEGIDGRGERPWEVTMLNMKS